MQQTTILILALSATLSLAFGCSDEKSLAEACQEVEDRNCQGPADCELLTRATFAQLVEVSGCSPKLDDLEQCLGDAPDICEEMCGPQGDLLSACLEEYCDTSQDSRCVEFGD